MAAGIWHTAHTVFQLRRQPNKVPLAHEAIIPFNDAAQTTAMVQELPLCIRTPAVHDQVRAATPGTPKYAMAPLLRLVAQARANIHAVWAQHGPSACVLLDAGRTFFSSSLISSANLATLAAAGLRFPPHIEALADRVANRIGPVFNGVHLRWAMHRCLVCTKPCLSLWCDLPKPDLLIVGMQD